MLRVDLHTHSLFSDGTLSPEQLAREAKRKKISVISLTDHDCVDGVELFLSSCRKLGIKGVSGIELSARYPTTLHILGYRFDTKKIAESEIIKKIRLGRNERNLKICQKLKELGIDVSTEGITARPHIAKAIVNKGYASSISDAFSKYLVRGAPAYEDRFRLEPEECVAFIRDAGGLPAIAHPWQSVGGDAEELRPLLMRLKAAGLWGLECYGPANGAAQTYQWLKLAAETGLYATAGSDFHGGTRNTELGVPVPDDMIPWARFCGGL